MRCYNLDGSLKALHYPSGAAVTYTPDSAGRILSAVDSVNNINYVTSAAYQADGQMTGFISGSGTGFAGITNSFSYNEAWHSGFISQPRKAEVLHVRPINHRLAASRRK